MDKKIVIAIASAICAIILLVFLFVMNKKNTVTFEVSVGVELYKQTLKKGEHVIEPKDPTREGYTFVGWFDGNVKFNFDSEVNSDVKLVAKWEKKDTAKISIISTKTELKIDEEIKLDFKITPENAVEEKEVKWSSSNEKVATVDENGNVKALNIGTVDIIAEIDELKSTLTLIVTNKEEVKEDETKTETKNTSKNSNTNTNKKSNNNTKNTETKTDEKKEDVTYSYKWEDVGSVVGQMRLYIVSSKGEKVTGTVTLTSTDGDKISETIPATGKILNKNDIASVTNIKVK